MKSQIFDEIFVNEIIISRVKMSFKEIMPETLLKLI
jgi:hypothetical protein